MVKMSMFKTVEAQREWYKEYIASQQVALERAKQEYNKAVRGEGKDQWLDFANIAPEYREVAWVEHLDWLFGHIGYFERKIRKLNRELAKI